MSGICLSRRNNNRKKYARANWKCEIINIPKVEVVKDILVYDREDVSKDHKKNIFNRNPNKKKNKIKWFVYK